ncbi:hypothetical protein KIN20_031021 [Parelaphostrongylus tenuis]|uniref:Uncharacterized protein n=1 Tax=Parelaphostrongylus tenuis TaxID=148309 RepID=A0AAD5R4J0_PARTN|nr:hypothetical protein KIN20_031021 [Parelaphostrongylus tenuis]
MMKSALMTRIIIMYSVIRMAPRTSGNHENHKSGNGGASVGTRSWIQAKAISFSVQATPCYYRRR